MDVSSALHFYEKTTSKTEPKTTTNLGAEPSRAARILGISRVTLSGYKAAGCPAFKSNGRVDLIELTAWCEIHGKRVSVDAEAMRAARLRIAQATAQQLEHANAMKSGKLIEKSIVSQASKAVMSLLFSSLDTIFINQIPGLVVGLPAAEVAIVCRKAIKDLQATLRVRLGAFGGGQ